jgi:hypothetical protein
MASEVFIDELKVGDKYSVRGVNLDGVGMIELSEDGVVSGNGYRPVGGGGSHLNRNGYSGTVYKV